MRVTPPFRELRPVLGPKAAALEQAYIAGDRDDRQEIEIVLELLRRRATSDRSVLLQPPAGDEADGLVRFGRIRHGRQSLGHVGVSLRELTQHMAVTGRSGSGKSTLCLHVLRQLRARSIPWIVFDYKRSARALRGLAEGDEIQVLCLGRDVGATLAWNILAPPPDVPVDTHQRQLAQLIAETWYAGDGVISLLERAMTQCYAAAAPAFPTIADVKRAVDELPVKSREVLWKTSAQRILGQMTTGPLGKMFCARADARPLELLRRGHTVLELDGLATADANFVTQFLLRWITQAMLAEPQREELRLVCLVEEAHHLLPKREGGSETVLETCLREGRELGFGIILADQCPSAVSPTALANCFTAVCLNARQRADVTAAAGTLLLNEEQRELLSVLPVGEAVVRLSDRWPWPVHVQIPPLDLPKGRVSDLDVRLGYLNGPFALSGDPGDPAPDSGPSPGGREVSRVPSADREKRSTDSDSTPPEPRPPPPEAPRGGEPLDDDGELRLLLEHVAQYPLVGVARRFDELGLSRRKGDALKRALLEFGYVVAVDVPTPSGKTVLLALTAAARHWLERHRVPITATNGGLAHAYWQDRCAALLQAAGWGVTTEHRVDGHALDVYATRGERSLAIEVETGSSSWRENCDRLERLRATHRAVLWLDRGTSLRVKPLVGRGVTLLSPSQLDKWIRQC